MSELVNSVEARKILGNISHATFYRMQHRGLIPRGTKISTRVTRWNRADLESYVKQRELNR